MALGSLGLDGANPCLPAMLHINLCREQQALITVNAVHEHDTNKYVANGPAVTKS